MKKLFLVMGNVLGVTCLFLLITHHSSLITTVSAQETKNVVIVNPIRGEDFWIHNHGILDTPKKELEVISKNNLSATWLVRYDGLVNKEVVAFLKSLGANQEVGLFLEVTPTFAQDAGVTYNQSPNWHYPSSAFLTGYKVEDRYRLIDTAVKKYKEIFGVNPKSVGEWWIDANSLGYLRQKYGIEANLDVADQYSTDQYQVWGQYFSTPFYPSKQNALMPAQSQDTKLGVVTMQWATRDPFNAYGNGVSDSTYSVQVNDYILHKLGINYFEKLLNVYPQVTVGLENDFSFAEFGQEYTKQIQLLAGRAGKGELKVANMRDFAAFYKSANPSVSPEVLIQADNPLGGDGKVVWYQTPKYRFGWFYGSFGSTIRDLRIYNDASQEACFKEPCQSLDFAKSFLSVIDDVTLSNRWVIDEGKIKDVSVLKTSNGIEIGYTNQSNVKRTIKVLPNDIEVNGKIKTLQAAILDANLESQQAKITQSSENQSVGFNLTENFSKTLINFLKFLGLTVLFFVLPGWVLTRNWFLSIPVGWVVFTLVSFLIGFLHLDILLWVLPVASLVGLWKMGFPKLRKPKLYKENLILEVLVLVGSASWLLTVVKSGLFYSFGLGFWGPNGHDAIWHLALISELQRNFPPNNPVFGGEKLSNYHYFFDLLLAKSGSLFGIDNLELLFRLFPLFMAVLSGILLFKVVRKITDSFSAGILATFFLYFGGSFGWVVSYFRDRSFGGESMFWSQQAISTLLNPPFAISVVLFLAGFYVFVDLLKNQNEKLKILCLVLLWGSLVEFKVYAGVLVLGSLGLVALYRFVVKRDLKIFVIFLLTLGLSLTVFLPNNLGAAGLLVISPFWLINSMIDFPDRLGWERLAMARQAYGATGNIFKFVFAEGVGLAVFLLGNFGTRALMVLGIRDGILGREIKIFLWSFFGLGIVLPLIFIQKGTNWNTVQFLYYSLVVGSIFAGIAVAALWRKLGAKYGSILVGLVILLTVPTTLDTFNQYLPAVPPAKLSFNESEALKFLSTQPQGIVLTLPFDEKRKNSLIAPLPLYAYTSTSYVAAFSNHPTFLEDTINLEILGVSYQGRLNEQRDFVKLKEQDKDILKRNNIQYLYTTKADNFQEDEGGMGVKKIYENAEVKIFEVI